jgi:uncharacterized protein YkwD
MDRRRRTSAVVAALAIWVPAVAGELDTPPARYNDPAPPSVRSALERRVDALLMQVARSERRTMPRRDPRLERVAADLARLQDTPGGPSNDLVEAALRLRGIVEPPPHLVVVGTAPGADEALLAELRGQLPHALRAGRYAQYGAAAIPVGDQLRIVIALQESFVELEPLPRGLPNGGPAPIRGRLLGGFERPSAFVTAPDGKTETIALGPDPRRFAGAFHCGPQKGRYQLELTAEDRFGSTVLANFPIWCGLAAPTRVEVPRLAPEAPVTDAASAESAVLTLVNQDRSRAGLRPLQPDARLAEVARAHCRDMLAHGFVGHVSPSTGNASDRVTRAKIKAALVLENVARAYSPGEVERGLMASPGHRRNILNAEATRVGIGAVVSEALGGQRELLVTQLFIAEQVAFQAATADQLRARLGEQRQKQGLRPFLRDPALDRIAESVARDLAEGRATPQSARAGVDRAISGMGERYRSVRALFAMATQITQIVESFAGPLGAAGPIPALGVGLAAGPTDSDGPGSGQTAHHAVLILAQPR